MDIDTWLVRLLHHLNAAQRVPCVVFTCRIVNDWTVDACRWHIGCYILDLIVTFIVLLIQNLQIGILVDVFEINGLWRTGAGAEYEGNFIVLALNLVSLVVPLFTLNFLALGNLVAWPGTLHG